MWKLVMLLVTSTLVASSGALSAQSQEEVCEQIAVIKAGEWMVFALSGEQGLDSMRFANVGDERLEGKLYHRYEMQIYNPQGSMVSQTLSAGRIFDTSDVKEMVIQMPGMPTQRLTGDMLRSSLSMRPPQNQLIADEVCKSAESLGRETVQVPAGDIRALRLQTKEGDKVWLSANVPGAMVKVITRDGMTMTLKRHGTGAQSTIAN